MNNTKEKESENEIVDFLMDNWNSNETEVKINYLRLMVKKYYEERNRLGSMKLLIKEENEKIYKTASRFYLLPNRRMVCGVEKSVS